MSWAHGQDEHEKIHKHRPPRTMLKPGPGDRLQHSPGHTSTPGRDVLPGGHVKPRIRAGLSATFWLFFALF